MELVILAVVIFILAAN